jgi:hypothetical protein
MRKVFFSYFEKIFEAFDFRALRFIHLSFERRVVDARVPESRRQATDDNRLAACAPQNLKHGATVPPITSHVLLLTSFPAGHAGRVDARGPRRIYADRNVHGHSGF